MPDTVDSLESYSLVVIVNRHAAAEDCAQSRLVLADRTRKSRRSFTDRYKSSNRPDERQELPKRSGAARRIGSGTHDYFGSSTTVSVANREISTSGRSSMTSRLRCFGLMKPSCTA